MKNWSKIKIYIYNINKYVSKQNHSFLVSFQNLKYTEEEEKVKEGIEVCSVLKLFGECKEKECTKRHIFNENLDVSNYLPKSDRIRFKIVEIHDVSHYSIKIIQHIDDKNNVHFYDENEDISEGLTDTLKIHRKQITDPVPGHYYAYYDFNETLSNYYRCRLLEKLKEKVKIILIDKGTVVETTVSRIFKLPNEFSVEDHPELSKYISKSVFFVLSI